MSHGLIELTFDFGVVLALGLWELFKIRSEIVRGRDGKDAPGTGPFPLRARHED